MSPGGYRTRSPAPTALDTVHCGIRRTCKEGTGEDLARQERAEVVRRQGEAEVEGGAGGDQQSTEYATNPATVVADRPHLRRPDRLVAGIAAQVHCFVRNHDLYRAAGPINSGTSCNNAPSGLNTLGLSTFYIRAQNEGDTFAWRKYDASTTTIVVTFEAA
jgi:hypothetical protein